MMRTEIQIAPYAPLLMYKKGYTAEFVFNTIKKNNLKGLRIFSHLKEDRLESVDFLKDFSFLETLHIDSIADFDFSFLQKMPNLKDLSIGVAGKNPIDLSSCVRLERLTIDWRKGVFGIDNCKQLEFFSLYGYGKEDLSEFDMLTTLKKLIVKSSKIKSLNGIDSLINIEDVNIANCKKLSSIFHLNGLNKLQSLEFNTCSAIIDFSEMRDLPKLHTLYLIDCKNVCSIRFIEKFPALKTFGLLGTTSIVDGDTLPAKNIQRLTYRHCPHYNFKIPTPEADALEKRNLSRIKKREG